MNYADAIDLSFIPKAITKIKDLLHDAAVAEAAGDAEGEWNALSEAGAESMVALRELHDHSLWDALRQEQEHRLQQWQDLVVPAVDRLLEELGYDPPPPAADWIDFGNEALGLAVGRPDRDGPDLITQAQDAIADLYELLDELTQSKRSLRRLKGGVIGACKVLAKAFGAAILAEAVRAAMHEINPHAAELLRDLFDHAARTLPSLSMVLVAGVVQDVSDLDRPDDQRSRDVPEAYEGFPRGVTPEGSRPYWRSTSESQSGPYPATERDQREFQGPDDIGGRAPR